MLARRMRRFATFGWRVMRGAFPRSVSPIDGSWVAIVVVALGFVGGGLADRVTQADSPWPDAIRGCGLVFALVVAVYREWSTWAPHDPPNLSVRPAARVAGIWTAVLRNADAPGRFRAQIIDVSDSEGTSMEPVLSSLWPMTVGWDDDLQPEYHLGRGQSVKLLLAEIWPGSRTTMTFLGTNELKHTHVEHRRLNGLRIYLRIARDDPEPSALIHRVDIEW